MEDRDADGGDALPVRIDLRSVIERNDPSIPLAPVRLGGGVDRAKRFRPRRVGRRNGTGVRRLDRRTRLMRSWRGLRIGCLRSNRHELERWSRNREGFDRRGCRGSGLAEGDRVQEEKRGE